MLVVTCKARNDWDLRDRSAPHATVLQLGSVELLESLALGRQGRAVSVRDIQFAAHAQTWSEMPQMCGPSGPPSAVWLFGQASEEG